MKTTLMVGIAASNNTKKVIIFLTHGEIFSRKPQFPSSVSTRNDANKEENQRNSVRLDKENCPVIMNQSDYSSARHSLSILVSNNAGVIQVNVHGLDTESMTQSKSSYLMNTKTEIKVMNPRISRLNGQIRLVY